LNEQILEANGQRMLSRAVPQPTAYNYAMNKVNASRSNSPHFAVSHFDILSAARCGTRFMSIDLIHALR
jgi:hypothetical protein